MSLSIQLNNYSVKIDYLVNLIKEIDKDELNYVPKRDEGWTITQHLLHVIHCELQSTLRSILLINKQTEMINIFDSKYFLNVIKTENIDPVILVNALTSLKELSYNLLTNLYTQVKENKRIICEYNSEEISISLKDNIESSIEHIQFHLSLIGENLLEYKENYSNN